NARTIDRHSATVRHAQHRHARDAVADEGHARQSQEIPDHPAQTVLTSHKQLVVNADDFGFTPDVNEGIVEAHCRGILTATTLMANGAAFEDAVRLAGEHPTLDVGCHLVLVSGYSVLTGRPFPPTVPELLL